MKLLPGILALTLVLLLSGCTGGSSKLFVTPSSQPFTSVGQTKKFVIEVEGSANVKISNTQITNTTYFQFAGGGGFGDCLGEVVEEGKPCTETIKLVKLQSGAHGMFKVTPQVGVIVESTLYVP